MSKTTIGVIYAVVMILVIVAVDVLFLRHHTDIRLAVNIGIVALFGLVYVFVVRRL